MLKFFVLSLSSKILKSLSSHFPSKDIDDHQLAVENGYYEPFRRKIQIDNQIVCTDRVLGVHLLILRCGATNIYLYSEN